MNILILVEKFHQSPCFDIEHYQVHMNNLQYHLGYIEAKLMKIIIVL